MPDIINPTGFVTGSAAISGTAAQLLASRERARGGVVINNQTDQVVFVASASAADNDAYPVAAGGELALGDYRGAVWIKGAGTGRVHYAYTE